MGLGISLQNLINSRKTNVNEVATATGISPQTIYSIIKRDSLKANIEDLAKIAHYLGADLNYFYNEYENFTPTFPQITDEEMDHISKYRALDDHGQQMIRLVADEELRRMELEAKAQQDNQGAEAEDTMVYVTQYYRRPMSAGTGQEAGDDAPESLHLKKEPPPGTSYVAPISGDSMEPTYHDGDHLFIHYQEEIYPGQIGVFFMDGQQWIKELGDGILISHNSAYPPRPMTEDIRCQGRVLGVCDESYFE